MWRFPYDAVIVNILLIRENNYQQAVAKSNPCSVFGKRRETEWEFCSIPNPLAELPAPLQGRDLREFTPLIPIPFPC